MTEQICKCNYKIGEAIPVDDIKKPICMKCNKPLFYPYDNFWEDRHEEEN